MEKCTPHYSFSLYPPSPPTHEYVNPTLDFSVAIRAALRFKDNEVRIGGVYVI